MNALTSRPSLRLLLLSVTVLCLSSSTIHGFLSHNQNGVLHHRQNALQQNSLSVTSSTVQDDDIQIRWDDEDNDDDDDDDEEPKPKGGRWEKLDPRYKQYLIRKGQDRAIRNKQKREPNMDKKRKVLMFMKEQQREKKKAAKVHRPLSFKDRTPLADMAVGTEVEGTVISLTSFGAYVDVGTECDGLLHISQISQDIFVEHPRQVLTPGDTVTVRIRSTNPDRQKLHLTMLSQDVLEAEQEELKSFADRIPLEDIHVDDELWGQIKRVTDFGAYIEVGAVCDGWLHFMDHPLWDGDMVPSDFMKRTERVRVWVSDIDRDQKRVKVTAHRPAHLPGPRREF